MLKKKFWKSFKNIENHFFFKGIKRETLTGYCDVIIIDKENIKTYLALHWQSLYDRNLKNENMLKLKKTFF